MASMIPRFPGGDFAPLFRLLDDYDVHRGHGSASSTIRAFQPKFDVREEKNAYQLHGELPGIEQKDIQIEFTDPQTLIIKGRVERESHSDSANGSESGGQNPRITEHNESDHSYHKATVEDEGATSQGASTPATSTGTEVAKHGKGDVVPSKFKYWVTERSVGEFHRSFSFPGRVDQDAVKASLKNGILSVVVPKAVQKESKRIQIS